jgi:GTPase involved in cell partitioning and DNA repair
VCSSDLEQRVRVLNNELKRFNPRLAAKEQTVVLNKIDTDPELVEVAKELGKRLKCEVLTLSGVSGEGLQELENHLLSTVSKHRLGG